MSINIWLKQKRIDKGFTLTELAEKSGLTHGQLSRLETGNSAMTLLTTVRIMHVLDLPWTNLFAQGFIQKDYSFPEIYGGTESKLYTYPCLNFSDISILDESHLLRKGLASSVVVELLSMFIMRNKPDLDTQMIGVLANSIYGTQLTREHNNYPHTNKYLPDIQFKYPYDFGLEKLRQIYLSGGVLILLDLGAYIKYLRESKDISLRQLGSLVNLSHPGLSNFETQMSERVRLADLIHLDNALDLKGELIIFAWRAAELYLGIFRQKALINKKVALWQQPEILLIENLIVATRLFQYYYPNDSDWLTWYRKNSIIGFRDLV